MEQKNYRALLSQPQYLKLLAANLVSRFGDSLDAIAYSWIMYEITGSESLMALIIGLNYIPTVLLQPFAGALVDRMRKKSLMAATDALRFFIVAVLVVFYAGGRLTPALMVILTLCTSTVEAFRIPAGGAFMPMLLEKEYYTVGKAANYSLSQACELIGFALAGAIIAWVGAVGALWIDAVTFAVSALVIMMIRVSEVRSTEKLHALQVFTDFRAGLSFLKGNRTVQLVSIIGLVINFGLMPLSVFQTPYVSDYLGMGPGMLSYIKILMIAGMMTGAAAAPKLLSTAKAKLSAGAGAGMGVSIVCMYIAARLESGTAMVALLTVSMFCVGLGGGILNVIVGGCMMRTVPKDMMGRMSALNSAVMAASMPIGSFLCFALVLRLNVVQIFLLFGIVTIVFYAFMGLTRMLDGLDAPS